jgi:hypothetical protein
MNWRNYLVDRGDKILYDILKDLNRIGILRYLVLIGGWCHRLYRKYYDNPIELTALTTYDLDLVIRDPEKIQININIKQELDNIGFIEDFYGSSGINKYLREDIEIEFLTARSTGKRTEMKYIKQLNTNTQSLQYLNILTDHTIDIDFYGLNVTIPVPAAFIFNKILVLDRRKLIEKRDKDIQMITDLLQFLQRKPDLLQQYITIFGELSKPVKNKIIKTAKKYSLDTNLTL